MLDHGPGGPIVPVGLKIVAVTEDVSGGERQAKVEVFSDDPTDARTNPETIQVLAADDDEIIPTPAVVNRENVVQLWGVEPLQLPKRNLVRRRPPPHAAAVGRLDLDASQFAVLIPDDEDVIAAIHFWNGGVIAAMQKLSHHGEMAATAGIESLELRRHLR